MSGSPSKKAASSLSHAFPSIAAQWNERKNKMLKPQHVLPTSRRLAWWNCGRCDSTFRAAVHDHVASHGRCPECTKLPVPRTEPAVFGDARDLSPMLAQSWDQYAHLLSADEELYLSPKLDGIRAIAAYDAAARSPYCLSRNGHRFDSVDHVTEAIEPLFKSDKKLVLDGELYSHEYFDNFELITSAVRTTKRYATEEDKEIQRTIKYNVFDIMYSSELSPTAPFSHRFDYLKGLLADLPPQARKMVCVVPHKIVKKGQVDSFFNEAVRKKYEGIMVRLGSSTYQCGKRSPELLKYKGMHDQEFTILDVHEGKGKWRGSLGAFSCKTKSGVVFQVNPSVDETVRAKLWRERRSLIGKALTVQYQSLTGQDVPRFPIGKSIRGRADASDWV